MKKRSIRSTLVLCSTFASLLVHSDATAADSASPRPPIIQAGFELWPKGGASAALEAWEKGGLIQGDRKVAAESAYFKRLDPVIGMYKSYDVIENSRISASSQLFYLALNFERAVVYARFLVYRTDQDWVVQNMDFNVKPEAIIPRMAFAGTPIE